MTETANSLLAAATVQRAMPRQFRVARVERTDAPDGVAGQEWYRYVLDNGRAPISGQRRGTHKEVTAYATQCAELLNVRGLNAQSIWAPRGRKPADKKPA